MTNSEQECPHCFNDVVPDAKFDCPECGNPINLSSDELNKRSKEYLKGIISIVKSTPCVKWVNGNANSRGWHVNFKLDLDDEIVWNVIQEYSTLFNYISLSERLPTIFTPCSTPSYMNGGPRDCLYWVIESKTAGVDPDVIAKQMEEYLPNPSSRDEWCKYGR